MTTFEIGMEITAEHFQELHDLYGTTANPRNAQIIDLSSATAHIVVVDGILTVFDLVA